MQSADLQISPGTIPVNCSIRNVKLIEEQCIIAINIGEG